MKDAKITVDTKDLEEGIKKVVSAVCSGTIKGIKQLQDNTYDYVMKRLKLFHHTTGKESFLGLVKSPIVQKRDGVVAQVSQKSVAGTILEYKIDVNGKAGIISLKNKNQKRAHKWLRSKGLTSVKVRSDSQISDKGPMTKVQPMNNAFEEVIEKHGAEIVGAKIMKEIERKLRGI